MSRPDRRPGSPAGPIPELTTERLLLRGWRDSDREPFARLNRDPAVVEHLSGALTRAESDALVDRIVAEWRERGHGLWAVELRRDRSFIGFIGLAAPRFDAHFTPTVEVGWRLARPAWGRGYATEGASAAVAWGFGVLGLDEIVSFTVPGNWRSRAVMERLGMTHDPADDFDLASRRGDVRRQVLYRLKA